MGQETMTMYTNYV